MTRTVARRIDVGGVGINVVDTGVSSPGRPPVVVLHGFTGDTGTMAPITDALAGDHRVLAVDLVGHGRSDAPSEPDAYSMRSAVEHVAGVCDRLGVGPVDVVGYSMGGRVALALAAWHPALVGRVVLIGASAGIADPAARAERRRSDHALATSVETAGIEDFVDRWMAQPLFATQAALGVEALAAARRQRLANRPDGLANSLRGMGTGSQPSLHDRLPHIGAEVHLVVGSLDDKFRAVALELAAALTAAEVHVVEGAGHAAHLERPGIVGALLREVLG